MPFIRSKWPYLLITALVLVGGVLAFALFRNDDPYPTTPAPQLPAPPLKELGERRGLQLGNFASLKYLRERPYAEIIAGQFEHAIIDGEPNWHFEDFTLRPGRDEYDFDHLDQVFDFADQHDMPVRVQHLLWGDEKWLPDWLKQGSFSGDELMQIIRDHIMTVGTRYKGRVREYTVVNEAFSRKLETGGNKDWWGERLGEAYIDNAFRWAREADPDAVLILNDFGNEYDSEITNEMLAYLEGALARGVPIDAVGMQMHIDGNDAKSREEVESTMRRFHALGLRVYVTEFDVNMHNVQKDKDKEDRLQADIYRDMVQACLTVGEEVCPSFGFLGLIDRQSWYRGIGLEDANPLMFNEDYSPKPAFYAVREALEGGLQ